MRILLVKPNPQLLVAKRLQEGFLHLEPLELEIVAAGAPAEDDVVIQDLSFEQDPIAGFQDKLRAFAPQIVGFTGYSSQSGAWGLSLLALASQAGTGSAWLHDAYNRWGKILSVGLVFGASLWPRPRPGPNALLLHVGLLMFLLVSSAPGFGVQYLAWLVPWVVILGFTPTATYYVAGTAFLAAYYTAAAGRFPWYFANSLERPAWNATVIGLGLICWVVVCCIALMYARRLSAAGAE